MLRTGLIGETLNVDGSITIQEWNGIKLLLMISHEAENDSICKDHYVISNSQDSIYSVRQ